MSSYSPYFDYTIKPATEEDPTPHCYKTEPYDMTKCDYGITGQKKSAYVSPNNMNMYHDGPAISYSEGKGFPTALSEDTAYFPVQDLTKDIYENTTKRKVQIDLLISEIHGFITTIDDVVMVAPIIKEYMDTAVKNDEHLVKLAGVLQRIISKSGGADDESMLLSDSEKEELMSTLQDSVQDLQNESDRLTKIKDDTLKTKKDFMGS